MSASTSCSSRAASALELVRQGESVPEAIVHALGEECPAEFFRIVIESLGDSFDPDQAEGYEQLMQAWIPPRRRLQPAIPERAEKVYVLSRVTLGADIKITSVILDAMKRRFPDARILLVGDRKSAELFAADSRIEPILASYPRSGPVSHRVSYAKDLSRSLDFTNALVIDPDSRITQLGLIPLGEPAHYFHIPTRTCDAPGDLTNLTRRWLKATFDTDGEAYIAPSPVQLETSGRTAAISLGVGENDDKRIGGDFEARLISVLANRFETVWVDRGVGGREAERVTAAVNASGGAEGVRYWEGSFAGFAALIAQADFYAGYDSAGQHAAAASGTPLVSFFVGAPSARFRERWAPSGSGFIRVIPADGRPASDYLAELQAAIDANMKPDGSGSASRAH